MRNSFSDDLKQEFIDNQEQTGEVPSVKELLDYIDGRIDERIENALDNIDYATRGDVNDAIIKFNDR